ncbi:MAG: IS66 family insertion sequence element accessory protein TnpB [Butyrivibrio sp.]|nr:IS66 family insertion sequence element accessory protein TnpB [Butyrivibrio sp.]
MDNITHEVRLAHWAEIVKQCQNRPEGMSASTWLKQNGIAIKNYYYWQRRVRNEVFDQVTSVATVDSPKNEMTFAEVPAELIPGTTVDAEDMNPVPLPDAIIKTGRMEIQIHNSLSPILLKSIMEVAVHAR